MDNRTLLYRLCPASASEQGRAVYWDANTKQQVSQHIFYGGTCTVYTLPAGTLIDAWCEGTTRHEVYSVWSGEGRPPQQGFRLETIPNSSKCELSNPCGLRVLDVQIVETGSNLFTATVIASHAAGLEFSLNNWADVQDSNVFEGLGPGTYNVRVRTKN